MNSGIIIILLSALLLSACNNKQQTHLVSEQPDAIGDSVLAATQAREGQFGLRARVRYADIEAIAANELPTAYPVRNEKQLCKRILGIKACGTANWDLTVRRPGNLKISGESEQLALQIPLSFGGVVGINGKVASALGLAALNVQGSLLADVKLGLTMQQNWCPTLDTDITYTWTQKPTIAWRGMLDFNLEKLVNDALDKQLASLQPRLNEAINCKQFRQQLDSHWRSYTFALDIPPMENAAAQKLHLNIVPTGFAFSGMQTEPDKLGVSFTLNATAVVASNPIETQSLPLPPLKQIDFKSSKTNFDLLLRADYTQLQEAIEPHLLGKTFTSGSPAGDVSVTVNSIAFSGNSQGVTVAMGFSAVLPRNRKDTTGIVYLNATPVVDTARESLSLQNVKLSKLLDSKLWDIIGSIFEGQIIAAIERNAVFNLAEQSRQLELKLIEQLQNPTRTGGVTVQANDLSIRLLEIVPENKALAARVRVSAELDMDIPMTAIQRPLK